MLLPIPACALRVGLIQALGIRGKDTVNWKVIAKYGAVLFLAQFVVGFLEGLFYPFFENAKIEDARDLVDLGMLVSLAVCTAIFAHLASLARRRPFAHAVLALLLYVAAGLLLREILAIWQVRIHLFLVVLELVPVMVALVIGTPIGIWVRRATTRGSVHALPSADA